VSDCLLCRIVAHEVRARLLHEDELVVPKAHLASPRDVDATHEPLLGRMVAVPARVAHLHRLGGRKLGPEG
jgi:hypothetical protein